MNITLEMIDEIVQRKKVSYAQAKEALEKTDGNVLEALVLLDQKKPAEKGFFYQIKQLLRRLHHIILVVSKEDNVVMRLPMTILILLFLTFFPLTIGLIILSLIFGYRLHIENSGYDKSINQGLVKISEGIDQLKK